MRHPYRVVAVGAGLLVSLGIAVAVADPLATFSHSVVGAQLLVSPSTLYVPKAIPGSLSVTVAASDGTASPQANQIAKGKYIQAYLRGPSFPAYPLIGLPNEPLQLPPIALVGDYEIDDIRMVDIVTHETSAVGNPSSVPVHVFPQVLVSQVTSRPLTLDEVQAKGIQVDASNFSAVQFQVQFTLEGKTFPVSFPVVSPRYTQSTEVISQSEIDAKLAQAKQVNEQLAATVALPPELQVPGLNLQVKGVNFQPSRPPGDDETPAAAPPIPALVVIPGSVGFLNRFFSVQIYTSNAAPTASSLSVHDIQAELILPPGRDGIVGTSDDPLAFARVGSSGTVNSIIPLTSPGASGATRLQPGQTAQGEFLVEGRKEGLQAFDIKLSAILDGFAAGETPITGLASGSVLIRNPKFSIVFSQPSTVRSGEPYTASVTVLNTSDVPADLVSINLHQASLSGCAFAPNQGETIALGTIASGQSKTASYSMIAQRTGAVTFTNLTSDDGLSGRFDLTMGVSEQGATLSSQVIIYPDWVSLLPTDLQQAADRVLGQALSNATAGLLPPGVRRVELETVRQRVVELAEAAQRISYQDTPDRTYLDLLLDWHGGRVSSLGFDQILRETDAGANFASVLVGDVPPTAHAPGLGWITARAPDLAGRGEMWGFAASGQSGIASSITIDGSVTSSSAQTVLESGALLPGSGALAFVKNPRGRTANPEASFRVPAGGPSATVAWVELDGQGNATQVSWPVTSDSVLDTCYHYFPVDNPGSVTIDLGCRDASTGSLTPSSTSIGELAPQIISALQDLNPLLERPYPFCGGPLFNYFGRPRAYQNYGTVLAVLFSKPMPSDPVQAANAFMLDNGVLTNGIQLQPGGRVALVNLRNAVSTWRPRTLQASNSIADGRGHALTNLTIPIQAVADQGVSLNGRVLSATGIPLANIPVTLTMNDQRGNAISCVENDVRVSQVFTDPNGSFTFDFVPAGIGYTLGATDVRNLSASAIAFILNNSTSGTLNPSEIATLASTTDGAQLLQQAFKAGSTQGAVAVADSVDRAVFTDFVGTDSPRIRSDVPIALQFRGRGTVLGVVYAGDGVTPVNNVAVNLFPDPGSREQGRGLFTDASGSFEFDGVPLGAFSVQATASDGRTRTIAGRLDTPGQTVSVPIALSTIATPMGSLAGTIYESDGVTPHAFATVAVTAPSQGTLAASRADANGAFSFSNLPAESVDVSAISFDGRRAVTRQGLAIQAGTTTNVFLTLPDQATVVGRVQFANGQPAGGAIVAGGEQLVTADASGSFTLTGVPTGRRTISAGLDVDPSRGINFVRIGSTSLTVLPGAANTAIVTLDAAGRIQGRVFDATGQPIPSVRVVIPQQGAGFFWTDADGGGFYSFQPFPLGPFQLAATVPALPVTDVPSPELVQQAAQSGSTQQLKAVLTGVFSGYASDFATTPVHPTGFGVTSSSLDFDGQTVTADIHFFETGKVSGTVLNDKGVPIGATVTLLGQRIDGTGSLSIGPIGAVNSDPATGAFQISGLPVGPYTVTAESPFYTVRASVQGVTTLAAPDASNLVLQFPAPLNTGARVTGVVLRDGSPVGAGAIVAISYKPDYQIQTAADGTFDTQIDLPPGAYMVQITDPTTGRSGAAIVSVTAGQPQPAFVTVSLLAVNGELDVTVTTADNHPAAGANLTVDRAGAPPAHFTPTANASGQVALTNLTEGTYSVTACQQVSQTQLCASGTAIVPAGGRVPLALVLSGSGSVAGTYVQSDGQTPVPFAQVTVGRVAIATTDSSGAFQVAGIPIGTYTVVAHNAVTGRSAAAQANVQVVGQVVRVLLREDALGDVAGSVYGSDGSTLVAGAQVTLVPSNPLFTRQTVTTDPSGGYQIPGVPPGPFVVTAFDPSAQLSGAAAYTMPATPSHVVADIHIEPRATLVVQVLEAGGAAAAATVNINGIDVDTDMLGQATFTNLPLGVTVVRAHATTTGRTRSRAQTIVNLAAAGKAPNLTLQLAGVGTVTGHLLTATGSPVPSTEVDLDTLGPATQDHDTALTAADGSFIFTGIAVAPVRARGVSGALAASATGTIARDGATVDLTLRLTPSADVKGVLVRADGVTAVPFTDIVISYSVPSGLVGSVKTRTSSTGAFVFHAVPEGDFTLQATVTSFDGLLNYRSIIPPLAGVLDLGPVPLDEGRPTVLSVSPADGSTGVPASTVVQVTFSRRMDTTFADTTSAYLVDPTGTHMPATLSWPNATTLALTPASPLASLTTYTVVILSDAQPLIHQHAGPWDQAAARSLAAPFLAHFTSIDSTPPVLVSFTPEDQALQIDPSSVVRITFSKPIDPASVGIQLVDAHASPVAATLSYAVNNQLLVLQPNAPLATNTRYTVTLSGAADRFGNLLAGTPITHTFFTLDTVGPTIVDLEPVGVTTLASGTPVTFVATLAAHEINPQLQATTDLLNFTLSNPGDLHVTLTMPPAGSAVLHARAIDRFGNYGPFFDKAITVVQDEPPVVAVVQRTPSSGPLLTGHAYQLEVDATATGVLTQVTASAAGAGVNQTVSSTKSPVFLQGTIPASVGPGQTVVVSVTARDNGGLVTTATPATYLVEDGTAPTVALTGPASPPRPGGTLNLTLTADDAFGVSAYTLVVSGAVTFSQSQSLAGSPTHDVQTFQIPVPSNAGSSAPIHVQATAVDAASNIGQTTFDLAIADLIPPSVTGVAPSNGAVNVPLSANVVVTFSEAVTNVTSSTFMLTPEGGTPLSANITLSSNRLSATLTPSSPLTQSTTYEIDVTSGVTDLAGNALPPLVSRFRTQVQSAGGPQLVAIRPANTSTNVALTSGIEVQFDAAVDPTTVSTANFVLANAASNTTTYPVTLTVLDGGRVLHFQPNTALTPGVSYVATLGGQPRDASGNPVRALGGGTWAGVQSTFTAASIAIQSFTGAYASTNRMVEGHLTHIVLAPQSGAPLYKAVFSLNGQVLGTAYGSAPDWFVTAPALGGAGSAAETLTVDAYVTGAGHYVLAPVLFTDLAASGDFDGDGESNDAEATAGTNPWVSDATQDADGDHLVNAQEISAGTDPQKADTDGDGIADGTDGDPLSGHRAPGVFLSSPAETLTALTFDGSGTHTFSVPVTVAAPVMFELWANPAASGDVWGNASNGAAINIGYDSTNHFTFAVRAVGSTPVRSASPNTSAINTWHHLAVSYDGATARLFVDGQHVLTTAVSGLLDYSGGGFGVGANYHGAIDEVRIWSYARAFSEFVPALHRSLRGELAGLVAAYNFEGPNRNEDATGHGYVATVGSPATTSGAPTYADRSLTLASTTLSLPFGTTDLDGLTVTLAVSRLPVHGTLSVGSTKITAPGSFSGSLTYTGDPGFIGTDEVDVTASAGNLTSSALHIQITTAGTRVFVGGNAAHPNDWSQAANWSPSGVPSTSDVVVIPEGSFAVALGTSATVGGLYVGSGSTLSINDAGAIETDLTVNGNAIADGVVGGNGFLQVGTGSLRGTWPNVRTQGTVTFTGTSLLSGDLDITSGQTIIHGQSVTVDGALNVNSALNMSNTADLLEVQGTITFTSASSILSAGILRGHGKFIQANKNFAFAPSGTHTVELVGPTAEIDLEGINTGNTFRNLTVTAPLLTIDPPQAAGAYLAVAGVLTLGSSTQVTTVSSAGAITVQGSLVVSPGSWLAAPSVTVAGTAMVDPASTVSISGTGSFGRLAPVSGALVAGTLTFTDDSQGSFTWSPDPAHVTFTSLVIKRAVVLGAALAVPLDINISAGSLTLNGNSVTAGGVLNVSGSGRITMNNANDRFEVQGQITLNNAFGVGTFSAGTLIGHSGFQVVDTGSGSVFNASGTHTVQLVGSSASIQMDFASATIGNRFQNLTITGSSPVIAAPVHTNLSYVWAGVAGNFTVGDGTNSTALTVAGPFEADGITTIKANSSFSGQAMVFPGTLGVETGGSLFANGTMSVGRFGTLAGPVTVASTLSLVPTTSFTWTPDLAHLSFPGLTLTGQVVLGGTLAVPQDLNINSGGVLTLNGQSVTVGGALSINRGSIRMSNTQDRLEAQGQITLNNPFGAGSFSAGTLIGHSGFQVVDTGSGSVFNASGAHTVQLVGSSAAIQMDFAATQGGNHFQNLTITAPSATASPVHTSASYVYLAAAGNFTLGNGTSASTMTLSGPAEADGNVTIKANSSFSCQNLVIGGTLVVESGGSLSANGTMSVSRFGALGGPVTAASTLTLTPDASGSFTWTPDAAHLSFPALTIQRTVVLGGALSVPQNLTISANSLTLNGNTVTVGGALSMTGSGFLKMNNAADLMDVQGAITFNTTGNGTFTAGLLRGRGNFSVITVSTGVFSASGSHTTELDGATVAIRLDNASRSWNHFQNLTITSPSAAVSAPGNSVSTSVSPFATTSLEVLGTLDLRTGLMNAHLTNPTGQYVDVVGSLVLEANSEVDNLGILTTGTCSKGPGAIAVGFTCQ